MEVSLTAGNLCCLILYSICLASVCSINITGEPWETKSLDIERHTLLFSAHKNIRISAATVESRLLVPVSLT